MRARRHRLFHGYLPAYPTACAAVFARWRFTRGLPTRAKTLAKGRTRHQLRGLPHEIDVRNYGLSLGIALESAAGKPGQRAFDVYIKCFERGLLIRQTADILALSPPLIVEPAQIEQMFGTLAEVLRAQ
jgi:beta-alanine--pyruvate transaminase